MTRLPLTPVTTSDPVVAEAFAAFEREGRDPIDLHRTLAHAPAMLRGFSGLGQALRHHTQTPRLLRELLILRIAQLTGSHYEWCHHLPMARAAGASEDQVSALAAGSGSPQFDGPARAVLRLAEEMHDIAVTDTTFGMLQEHFTAADVIELVVCAAHYESAARVLQALQIDVEPGYQPS